MELLATINLYKYLKFRYLNYYNPLGINTLPVATTDILQRFCSFQIDCGKRDMTTIKNVLHFVTTGSAKYMFNVGKELFFVPAIMILKCLSSRSDVDIYAKLTQGKCGHLC